MLELVEVVPVDGPDFPVFASSNVQAYGVKVAVWVKASTRPVLKDGKGKLGPNGFEFASYFLSRKARFLLEKAEAPVERPANRLIQASGKLRRRYRPKDRVRFRSAIGTVICRTL